MRSASLLLLALLSACYSSSRAAPSEVEVGVGYAENETAGAPSLDHRGPIAWVAGTWVIASGRKAQEATWNTEKAVEGLRREVARGNELAAEALDFQRDRAMAREAPGITIEAPKLPEEKKALEDYLTDLEPGEGGVPPALWAALVLSLLAVAKHLGWTPTKKERTAKG